MLIAWFRKGNISCASSPPFRQINPLGNALICSFFIFLRTIFTRSARGITARLTTKSNSCFSSSARALAESYVFQSDCIGYFGCYAHFLADTVNQMKFCFRKQDCQRNAGETSARTQVHNACAGTELDDFGNTQRMKYVMFV